MTVSREFCEKCQECTAQRITDMEKAIKNYFIIGFSLSTAILTGLQIWGLLHK